MTCTQKIGSSLLLGAVLLVVPSCDQGKDISRSPPSAAIVSAGTPTRTPATTPVNLVRDILPGSRSSGVRKLTPVGDTLFFVAKDGNHGRELWRSDGTAVGTVIVKDIFLGPSRGPSASPGPYNLTDVEGALFFAADDGEHGYELWRSDGTEAGTVMVKDISPGKRGSFPGCLTAVGNTVYFGAIDGTRGRELWRSDGSETGTVMVKDILPGDEWALLSLDLAAVGTSLFFVAQDLEHGIELWRSDGTEAGTVMVKDIWRGPDGSNPDGLTDVGDALFFAANDGEHGQELWRSDGTEAGTLIVGDALGRVRVGGLSDLTLVGSTLFFCGDDGEHGSELWRSDGTEAGTVLVKDIRRKRYYASCLGGLVGLTATTLLFVAVDQEHGSELWRSDGTEAGTVLVKDIYPGRDRSPRVERAYPRGPWFLTEVGGIVYFSADDGRRGRELWKSDGSGRGTLIVENLHRGEEGSYPRSITDEGGMIFFSAETPATGRELWVIRTG